MKKDERSGGAVANKERRPHHVRLPGFIADEDLGLGDAIKRVTYAVGIKPCGGCERRAAILNRWLAFTASPRK